MRCRREAAARFAARAKGAASGAGGHGESHGASQASGNAAGGERTGGSGHSAGADLSQLVSRLPNQTIADLKAGDAVMIVASQPDPSQQQCYGCDVAVWSGANSCGNAQWVAGLDAVSLESGWWRPTPARSSSFVNSIGGILKV